MVTRADRVIIRPDKTDARSKIAQAPSEHRPIDFPQIAVNRMHAGNGRAFSPDYSHPFMQLEFWSVGGESGRASTGEVRTAPYPCREMPLVVLPLC